MIGRTVHNKMVYLHPILRPLPPKNVRRDTHHWTVGVKSPKPSFSQPPPPRPPCYTEMLGGMEQGRADCRCSPQVVEVWWVDLGQAVLEHRGLVAQLREPIDAERRVDGGCCGGGRGGGQAVAG